MSTTTYLAPEISCDHCKQTIESAVGALDGVELVEVDVDTKQVTVVGGDAAAITEAITDVGFDIA